jgi:hypothetical protein
VPGEFARCIPCASHRHGEACIGYQRGCRCLYCCRRAIVAAAGRAVSTPGDAGMIRAALRDMLTLEAQRAQRRKYRAAAAPVTFTCRYCGLPGEQSRYGRRRHYHPGACYHRAWRERRRDAARAELATGAARTATSGTESTGTGDAVPAPPAWLASVLEEVSGGR